MSPSGGVVANSSSLDWDEDEQGLWKHITSAKNLIGTSSPGGRTGQKRSAFPTSTATIPTSLAGISFLTLPNAQENANLSLVHENDEQLELEIDDRPHWMPDKLRFCL